MIMAYIVLLSIYYSCAYYTHVSVSVIFCSDNLGLTLYCVLLNISTNHSTHNCYTQYRDIQYFLSYWQAYIDYVACYDKVYSAFTPITFLFRFFPIDGFDNLSIYYVNP